MPSAPPLTVSQALALGAQHHYAGRLAEAEVLYRQVLAIEPKNAEALHRLGLVAHQAGRDDLATQFIGQALQINPDNPSAHCNLGVALAGQRRWDEATAAYQRALQLKRDYPEAYLNLALALSEREQDEQAVAALRTALEFRPDFLEACYNLGSILLKLGRCAEAAVVLQRAVELRPDYPEALFNLGIAFSKQGRTEEALGAYRKACASQPNFLDAHLNLGNVLSGLGQWDEAIATYRRALQIKPDYAVAHTNLGNALRKRGDLEEAIAAHRRALQIDPGCALACNNLGNALNESHDFEEAIAWYRRAIELTPEAADLHYNLGANLARTGQLDEAMAAYRDALRLKPDYVEVYGNLANTLGAQGRLEEALAASRQALHYQPDYVAAQSNIICQLLFHPAQDYAPLYAAQRQWDQQFARPLQPLVRSREGDENPERRLRIGYVSPDLRDHVIGRNLIPLFRCHDHAQFEILCYSGVARSDALTEFFRQHSDHWRCTVRRTDESVVEMIRQDGVDILVDLTQHAAENRLLVFARQPAPVQVSFAAFPFGAGLEAIGYRISDRYLERASGPDSPAPEKVCLLDSFWCYDPYDLAVEINPLPALGNGAVTFGCLNNFLKTNEPLFRLWARILGQVENSRLVLLSPRGSHRQRPREILQRAGIAKERVEFVDLQARRSYLETYHRLDIALDPFPYNGHTTSLDALWMGVPVVSMVGEHPVGRGGLSQLSNLGLAELAALSGDDYVRVAVELAHDLSRLAELRKTLRTRMRNSALTDAPRFARGIEAAYRAMWRGWCAKTAKGS